MCPTNYCLLLFMLFILDITALNCRSGGGHKEEELKNIYQTCLNGNDKKNSSDNKRYSNDNDSHQSRGYSNQRSQWDRRDGIGSRDDRMNDRDDMEDSMGRKDYRNRNRDDSSNGMSSRDERTTYRDRINGRDYRIEGDTGDRSNSRNDMTGKRDDSYGRNFQFTGREDFPQNEDFSSDGRQFNNYRTSTQSPRRYKREKKNQMNSGQRSQYNPNPPQRGSGKDDTKSYRNDGKNSSDDNSMKASDHKACALHCFLENLEMTSEDGMPDRYLVTHVITKDVKNEDLRDFLQESIEECFQILDNEHTDDKCEFAQNLMICLSEKGKANCDDWKEDLHF